MTPYTEPAFKQSSFNCPNCGAFAQQFWTGVMGANENSFGPKTDVFMATCSHCNQQSYWREKSMIYPLTSSAPLPNTDMPEDVKQDYQEARNIVNSSPRGAAALLRLAIQKLCVHLGESGENINNDIGSLVKKGLPDRIQKALDSVRVVGNNAVHPGVLDLKDDVLTAHKLFAFVNMICDSMITQPKELDKFYSDVIPDRAKEAIGKRDGKK
jgi:hypothetical protein